MMPNYLLARKRRIGPEEKRSSAVRSSLSSRAASSTAFAATSSSASDDLQFLEKHVLRHRIQADLKTGDSPDGGAGHKRSFVIDPSSVWHYRWLGLMTTTVLYNLTTIILRTVFNRIQTDFLGLWLTLDYTCDAIYMLDIVVQLHTGFLDQGLISTDTKQIRKRYLSTKASKVHFLSLLPTDLLYLIPPVTWNRPYVRFNRLIRIDRMFEFFDRTDMRINHPVRFRLATLLLYILIIIHWNACFYMQLSEWIGIGSDGWVYGGQGGGMADSVRTQYVYSLFWSTLMLTTIANLPKPETDVEYLFVIANFLVGVLIFATIVGSFSGMIATLNQARNEFQNRADAIKTYMEMHRIDRDLQTRVVRWFDYMWSDRGSTEEDKVIQFLPESLRAELAIQAHLGTLMRVSIFQDCEPGLLMKLVVRLRLVVYSPGDYVCRKGDIGTEMYIIRRGLLNVVADDGTTVYATLSEGGFFGEVSLLDIPGNMTGNRRVANVRSIGYSDLFVLSKVDLWSTLDEYPEAKSRLIEAGRQRLRLGNLFNEEAAEMVDKKELKDRLNAMEKKLNTLATQVGRMLGEFTSTQGKLRTRVSSMEHKLMDA